MKKNLFTGGMIAILIVVGIIFFTTQKPSPENSNSNSSGQQAQTKEEGKMISGYSGKVLAGSASPYIVFNKADYDKALADNKIIFLDFFANWCPICREEAPNLKEGFDALQNGKVVGFRVNYNDSDTDADEKKLASKFSVPYQHTKVILKNGQEVTRSLESWDKETFLKTINDIVGK